MEGRGINSQAPIFTGTRMQATSTRSPSGTPTPSHRAGTHVYNMVPMAPQEPPTPDTPAPVASAPPAYDEVMEHSDAYRRPEGADTEPPPPSYDAFRNNVI